MRSSRAVALVPGGDACSSEVMTWIAGRCSAVIVRPEEVVGVVYMGRSSDRRTSTRIHVVYTHVLGRLRIASGP